MDEPLATVRDCDSTQEILPSSSKGCNYVYSIQRFKANQRKKGLPFTLTGDKVTIGRSPEATIFLASSSISRCHAILMRNSSGWSVQDFKSTNGVYLNGNKLKVLKSYLLYPEDVISLGPPPDSDFTFLFLQIDGKDSGLLDPPCKIAKGEENELSEGSQCSSEVKKAEDDLIRQRLEELEKKLKDKEDSEKILQEKLMLQEKTYQESLEREKERILKEKGEAEKQLKENLQITLEMREQQLKEIYAGQQQALLSEKQHIEEVMKQKLLEKNKEMDEKLQQEQQRLEKELGDSELKAAYLQIQLRESTTEADQARVKILSQFEELVETEMTCSVCSELFIKAVTLGCAHTFCLLCITQWKRKKKECPICRTKIKSETRALVIDNFIERSVEKMPPQLKATRLEIINSRQAGPSSNRGVEIAARSNVPPLRMPLTNIALQPTGPPGNRAYILPSTLRNPTVVISRLNGAGGQNGVQQDVRVYFQPQSQQTNMNALGINNPGISNPMHNLQRFWGNPNPAGAVPPITTATTNATIQPNTPSSTPYPSVLLGHISQSSASNPQFGQSSIVVSQPSVMQQQAATPVYRIQNPVALNLGRHQTVTHGGIYTGGNLIPGTPRLNPPLLLNSPVRHRAVVSSSPVVRQQTSVTFSARPQVMASTATSTNRVFGQAVAHSNQSNQAPAPQNAAQPVPSVLVISDSSDDGNDTESNSSESSIEGNADHYYGGYGRCYRCGRRGHWSRGCPNSH